MKRTNVEIYLQILQVLIGDCFLSNNYIKIKYNMFLVCSKVSDRNFIRETEGSIILQESKSEFQKNSKAIYIVSLRYRYCAFFSKLNESGAVAACCFSFCSAALLAQDSSLPAFGE